MTYSYEVAEEKDESELRRFIASMPMPGAISIRFERNPDYFAASPVEGSFSETLIVRAEDGSVTGLGNRADGFGLCNAERLCRIGFRCCTDRDFDGSSRLRTPDDNGAANH